MPVGAVQIASALCIFSGCAGTYPHWNSIPANLVWCVFLVVEASLDSLNSLNSLKPSFGVDGGPARSGAALDNQLERAAGGTRVLPQRYFRPLREAQKTAPEAARSRRRLLLCLWWQRRLQARTSLGPAKGLSGGSDRCPWCPAPSLGPALALSAPGRPSFETPRQGQASQTFSDRYL